MNTLYLECNMGAAGDMLTAALLELLDDQDDMLKRINTAGIPGVVTAAEPAEKCGVKGTHMRVNVLGAEENGHDHPHEHSHSHEHDHSHEHSHPHERDHSHEHNHSHEHGHSHSHSSGCITDIFRMIENLHVSDQVKRDAKAVYALIANAESQVHGVPMSDIHFHEVGTLDAIADVVSVCMIMETLNPAKVLASPVATGGGHVRCAHGLLPVPAPATALILQGIPIYSGGVNGELCTPTGAALLKHFVSSFLPMPVLYVEKMGYGMGSKDFERANCVRAFWGNAGQKDLNADTIVETITELSCNLDDMTPEAVAFAQSLLLEQGALDAFAIPIVMKKSRAAVMLVCLCRQEDADNMAALIIKHTSTLGVRMADLRRTALKREERRLDTPYGSVRVKTASGLGCAKFKAEFDDIAAIARREGITLGEITKAVADSV